MVVTRVYGGLGNQMFQYAAGLGVADRLGAPLRVDTSWFRQVPPSVGRTYQLDAFGIDGSDGLRGRLVLRLRHPAVVRETGFAYDDAIEQLRGDVLLDGYWQSYRYFEHCEERVRAAFAFPPAAGARSERLLGAIRGSESVSIHVRRGDYLAPKRTARFGVLSLDYYRAAIERVRADVPDARFFAFSDDVEWCRLAFAEVGDVVLAEPEEGGAAPVDDMALMAACRHNVVANSSFSWWGAWLNANPRKLVVAPREWFRDPSLDTSSLVPPEWVRL